MTALEQAEKKEFSAYCWSKSDLSYQMRNVQKLIREAWEKSKSVSRKFVINCNRRLGKSTWGLEVLTEEALKKPNFHGLFCAPVKDSLREYVAPLIVKVMEDAPDDLRPTLDSHLVLRFENGSSITFRGSNSQSYQNLRGNDFDLIFVDEFRNLDEGEDLLKSVLLPSIFNSQGFIIIASTPPDTQEHYLNELNQEAEMGGYYFHCDINECARLDESDFKREQIEEWRKETNSDIVWTREYLALFIRDITKTVIPEWDDKYCSMPGRDEYFPLYHKYVGMDLGVRDKTAAVFGYYDFKLGKLIIEAEFTLQDSEVLTENISNLVKAKEKELCYVANHARETYKKQEPKMRRWCDNDNPMLLNDLNSKYDLDFSATGKEALISHGEITGMVNVLREWVNDGRVCVDKSCKELLGCLNNAVWDKNKKELARSKTFGHFDALMALVYLVRNVDTSINPIPAHFGKTFYTHAMGSGEINRPLTTGEKTLTMIGSKSPKDEGRENFIRGIV